MYKNRWIIFPWYKDQDLDHLIVKEDIDKARKIGSLGISYCLDELNARLRVAKKCEIIDVNLPEQQLKVLPNPKYTWDEYVLYKDDIYQIDHISWHHKEQHYYYSLKGRKRVTKRIVDNDLISIYKQVL